MTEPPAEVIESLHLGRLGRGYPGLTPNGGVHLAQACTVCLEERGHVSGMCRLVSRGAYSALYRLAWSDIDDRVVRQWNDDQEATEEGACGLAILLITSLTDFQVVMRSRKGTGFDYWLGRKDDELFQNAARLEVSGIRFGDQRLVDRRLHQKREQTKRSDGALPAFVVVVEFGTPLAVVEKR